MKRGQSLAIRVVLMWPASLALAMDPNYRSAEPAVAAFQQTNPRVRLFRTGAHITRIYGGAFGWGASPPQTVDRFVQDHAAVFRLQPKELRPGSVVDGRRTQPVLYDRRTGTYKFTLAYYHQERDGIPVFRAELRLLVRNEIGHPLVLAASSLREIGNFQPPPVDPLAAINVRLYEQSALAVEPSLVNFTPPRRVVFAGVGSRDASPALAAVFYADNDGVVPPDEYNRWLFVVDAVSGAMLYRESQVHHVDVVGNVSGRVTNSDKASDECVGVITEPLPYAQVDLGASTSVYADVNGDFTMPNAGIGDVTLNSKVRGRYFFVQNQNGSNANLNLTVTPPGPANF
ncbi:MAG: hypothetical protein V3T70_06620, partial [Phycisphaerae bacterium]